VVIVRDTGEVRLTDVTVGPGLTRRGFRAMAAREGWTITTDTSAWFTATRATTDAAGRPVTVRVWFTADRLAAVDLCFFVGAPDTGEEGWSDAGEAARKALHDALVREWLQGSVLEIMYGPPPEPGPLRLRFDWGRVISETEPRAGASLITVSYAVPFEA
jgi:hypothetical protein